MDQVTRKVADDFEVSADRLFAPARYPEVVKARRVLCDLAVRALGISGTDLARQMGLTQPPIRMAVKRGEGLIRQLALSSDPFLA